MSIIYDALKKIEKGKSVINKDNNIKKSKKLYSYFVYLLFVVGGFILAGTIFEVFSQLLLKKEDQFKLPEKKTYSKEEISYPQEVIPKAITEDKKFSSETPKLSGIFYDPLNPYVIIDNRIFKKGDCLKGYCIKEILSDKVVLESEEKDRIIELNIKDQ
jgi:hypothetical protein